MCRRRVLPCFHHFSFGRVTFETLYTLYKSFTISHLYITLSTFIDRKNRLKSEPFPKMKNASRQIDVACWLISSVHFYTSLSFNIVGGWTLLKRTTIPGNLSDFWTKSPVLDRDYNSISNYKDNLLFVSIKGIQKLRQTVSFNQLRWYCFKKKQGSVFHVMTRNNSAGYRVLDYFLKDATTPAAACDSFVRLPDDNSTLSQNCAKWGHNGNTAETNEWGYFSHNGEWRLYRNVCVWTLRRRAFSFRPPSQFWCDDEAGSSSVSQGDTWEVYAR